ncbi:hypothetical protein Bca4012_015915 [Brassica carinata]|uniref:Uncharacterized protein n=1 Tax=Brassica carinata TaxID=52824 RepID=A0A8X8BGK2_BRACI|nr:hypothetical protein Bca52824_005807 [Brassica carinata]
MDYGRAFSRVHALKAWGGKEETVEKVQKAFKEPRLTQRQPLVPTRVMLSLVMVLPRAFTSKTTNTKSHFGSFIILRDLCNYVIL